MDWSLYVGVPYAERGRGPTNYDCWGLVREIYRTGRGITLPSLDECETIEAGMTEHILSRFEPMSKPYQSQPYDIVVMRTLYDAHIGHVGVVIDEQGNMLHLHSCASSVIENVHASLFSRLIVGVYRWAV
ncbi:MAG: tail assembly protein [Nitrospirales bacterium]|nr:MAG: tail assembly protein [Nitrospirales bacterium]